MKAFCGVALSGHAVFLGRIGPVRDRFGWFFGLSDSRYLISAFKSGCSVCTPAFSRRNLSVVRDVFY